MKSFYDITDFGAKGDGTTPADGAINSALERAYADHGGIVWIPPGVFLIEKKILIKEQVKLAGSGWSSRDTSHGSWIRINKQKVNLEIRGQGTIIQGLGFTQDQPIPNDDRWAPYPYDFLIHAGVDDVFLKEINLLNCTNGINIKHFNDGPIGRVTLDHIWGRPLRRGIEIENARDVIKINNIHFWRFWEMENEHVNNWTNDNGTAIQVFRADNPQFSNIFVLGYNLGFAFGESSNGPTSKFAIINADCDSCESGIEINGANVTGSITNYNSQGLPGNVGIRVKSAGVRLFASNIRITNYRGNAIRASGSNTKVFINNLWAELWNKSGRGFPAVEATDNAIIYLGRPAFFDRGNGARNIGANGGIIYTEFDELISQE